MNRYLANTPTRHPVLGPRYPPLNTKTCPTDFFCVMDELLLPIQGGTGFFKFPLS